MYPGDPLTPGVGATAGAKRLTRADGDDASSRFRCCRFPTPTRRKLLAALGGPVVAGKLARRPADHLSLGRQRRGQGASRGQVRLVAEADLRRDRDDAGLDRSRPVDRARQPPRRLGVRRVRPAVRPGRADGRGQGARRALPPGLAARRGPSSTRAGTARSRGCSARPNGPRRTPTSCSARRCSTSTPTPTAAASSMPRAATRCSTWSTRPPTT